MPFLMKPFPGGQNCLRAGRSSLMKTATDARGTMPC